MSQTCSCWLKQHGHVALLPSQCRLWYLSGTWSTRDAIPAMGGTQFLRQKWVWVRPPFLFENFSHIIPFFFLSASLTCGSHSSQLVLSLAPFPNFVFPSYICHCLNWTVKYHWPIMFAFVLHIKFVYIHIWICTLYIVCVQLEENTPGDSSSDWWSFCFPANFSLKKRNVEHRSPLKKTLAF